MVWLTVHSHSVLVKSKDNFMHLLRWCPNKKLVAGINERGA